MQNKTALWPWLIGAILVAGIGWWLFRPDTTTHTTASPPAFPSRTEPPVQAPPSASAAAPGGPQHPVESPAAADPAIPALADSDAAAWEALSNLAGDASVLDVLLRDHLIQRLVTMVDNLPRRSATRQSLALRPLPGELQLRQDEAGATLAPANAERYVPYVKAFAAVDPQALARAYRRFYPLFQQAYVELGYPDGYFNDRLVQVIDHLLQAPEPAQPPLVEPNGRGKYRFVDPALESLSVGQKALVRLGPGQEAAVKRQLRAIRAALTRS
ncbi:DUF3014 domain-containing protein [[Pseudomonas] boreopolis]|uniref:DUF3014 domain-containing protein n=1 Tax=Xanthomonas boreopolis TaxID=86183 RepID=UPI003D9B9BBB